MKKVIVGTNFQGKYLKAKEKIKLGYREVSIPDSLCNGTVYCYEKLVSLGYIKPNERVFYVI